MRTLFASPFDAPCFLLGKPQPGCLQSFAFTSELSVNGANGIDTDLA